MFENLRRLATVSIITIIIPLKASPLFIAHNAGSTADFNFESKLTLKTDSAQAIASPVQLSVIQPGESALERDERQKREKAETLRREAETRQVIAREKRIYASADFDLIYMQAASSVGAGDDLARTLRAIHGVESGFAGTTSIRSSANAIGPMQFLEGTFVRYKTHADAQISDPKDAIFAAARLLAANGWLENKQKQAILAYNHSESYYRRVAREAGL